QNRQGRLGPIIEARTTARRWSHDDMPGSRPTGLPATPLSRLRGTGGFASPPYDGFALCFRDAARLQCTSRGRCTSGTRSRGVRAANVSTWRRADLTTLRGAGKSLRQTLDWVMTLRAEVRRP